MTPVIKSIKKLVRQNSTLIRRSRKATYKQVKTFLDKYLERTSEFRELVGYTNSVIPEVNSRP